jgi:tetratricopeptide (TPR) repeat protein
MNSRFFKTFFLLIKQYFFWYCIIYLVSLQYYCIASGSPNNSDSIVTLSELSYNSKLEETAFRNYFVNNRKNYIDLFLVIHPEADAELCKRVSGKIGESIYTINNSADSKKGIEKKSQFIFKHVHNNYLKKYILDNRFHQIFDKGEYNCVSASALYAIIFDSLKIPYTIKETPTHVYLIAYPVSDAIRVETTDPVFGYYQYNEQFKTKYITSLKQNKLISEEEFSQQNIEDLFNKYYLSDTSITLSQLIALQYVNDALFKLEKQDYKGAYSQLEKAYLFYPSRRVCYTLLYTGMNILLSNEFINTSEVNYFIKLSRFLKLAEYEKVLPRSELINEFAKYTDKMILGNYRPELYDSVYNKMNAGISDTSLMNEISFIYSFHKGQALYMQMQITKSLPYLEKAFELRPNNLQAQTLLVGSIATKVDNIGSIETVLSEVNQFINKYPKLLDNDLFNGILMNVYLAAGGYYFSENKQLLAEEYQGKFEKLFEQRPGINYSKELVGNSYAEAASFYFKKGNYTKTKAKLLKGLEYSPDNYKLKKRLEMMN